MAKILAPNKHFTGTSAGVAFAKGVGETENPHLINWFKEKGYSVEESVEAPTDDNKPDQEPSPFEGMDVDQLKAYAEEHKIDIGRSTSVNGIIEKIIEAQSKQQENQ